MSATDDGITIPANDGSGPEEYSGGEKLRTLSDTLNRLARRNLSAAETQEARANLAAMAADFNTLAAPAAAQLMAALPDVADKSAKWVMAKMLRDAALADAAAAPGIVDALYEGFAKTGDASARQMASGLLRDIGLRHEDTSVQVAAILGRMMAEERDTGARMTQKNALMSLSLMYEATAPVTASAIAQALMKEPLPGLRIQYAQDLRLIALKYPSQAANVLKQLGRSAQVETDDTAQQKNAENIALIAQQYPAQIPAALTMMTQGFRSAAGVAAMTAYAAGLLMIGERHPAGAIGEISQLLDEYPGRDHRRILITSLSSLAETGGVTTAAAATVLIRALAREDEPFNRRLIAGGLLSAALMGNGEENRVALALKTQLSVERDPGTVTEFEKSLHRLGHKRPAVSNVMNFQPKK